MALTGFEHCATNEYFDRQFGLSAVKVLPGEYYVTNGSTLIVTVLGSCVSVCLRDKDLGIGGLNHFLLPQDNTVYENRLIAPSGRYGVYAMELLINHLLKLGARKNRLEAKVFGGGRVLKHMTLMNVGDRNVRFVLEHLASESIPVVAQDVLDTYPRKVYFFPKTGKVMLKKIRSLHNTTILEREQAYLQAIATQPISGAVDLF